MRRKYLPGLFAALLLLVLGQTATQATAADSYAPIIAKSASKLYRALFHLSNHSQLQIHPNREDLDLRQTPETADFYFNCHRSTVAEGIFNYPSSISIPCSMRGVAGEVTMRGNEQWFERQLVSSALYTVSLIFRATGFRYQPDGFQTLPIPLEVHITTTRFEVVWPCYGSSDPLQPKMLVGFVNGMIAPSYCGSILTPLHLKTAQDKRDGSATVLTGGAPIIPSQMAAWRLTAADPNQPSVVALDPRSRPFVLR